VLATVNFIAKGGVELTRGRARTAKDGRSGGWLAKKEPATEKGRQRAS
jgi:hypothetical protein